MLCALSPRRATATIKGENCVPRPLRLVSGPTAWMSGRGAYYVEMISQTRHLVAIPHWRQLAGLVAPPGAYRPRARHQPDCEIAVASSRGPIMSIMGTSVTG